jgi:hypothetical protein
MFMHYCCSAADDAPGAASQGLVGGMGLGDLNKILQLTDDFADKYGPVMMYQFFSAKYLVVTDPTLADEVGEGPSDRSATWKLQSHVLQQ